MENYNNNDQQCKVVVSFVATFKIWKKYLPQIKNHNL